VLGVILFVLTPDWWRVWWSYA